MILTFFIILFRKPFNFALPKGKKQFVTQKLDHFDSHSNTTFEQCYYSYYRQVNNENPTSLVLYLGSEDVPDVDFSYSATQYAEQTNSYLVSLEHRFFGSSFPRNSDYNLTKDSLLQYLTIQQVLNDIAFFINFTKELYCNECTVTIFGGGYLGALSSWFHVKYPHLSTNVVSSSSPIIINQTLPSYDENIYHIIENYNSTCSRQISKLLQTDSIDTNDLYILSESTSNTVLYPKYTPSLINDVCKNLKDDTIEELKEALDNSNEQLSDTFESLDFNSYMNTSLSSEYRDYRSWTWLRCTEIGLWHTTSTNSSSRLRPVTITEDFFNEICLKLFDHQMSVLDAFNYGNQNMIGTNTLLINAQNDPMSSFSFINNNNTMIHRFSYNVENILRFEDMADTSSEKANLVRDMTFNQLNNWTDAERNPLNCDKGIKVFGVCRCDEHYGGDRCQHKMHPGKSFKIVTILSVVVPTLLLLIIGGGVWFCGKREDNEIGARPTLYT